MRAPIPSNDLLSGIPEFRGFPREGRKFLVALGVHNDRHWFEEHRAGYQAGVLEPMRGFVLEAGRLLRKKVPKIVADPRVGGSVTRIARDTRFSADKSPYKTYAACHLHDSSGLSRDFSAGFYFHIDAETVYAGGGIYWLGDDQLDRFRKALSDKKKLRELRAILKRLGDWELGGKALKRGPRGFPPDHPAADLLLHRGLYAGCELDSRRANSPAILKDAMSVYLKLLPLHRWLMKNAV